MQKKRLPILQKVSNLFKMPIFIAKVRKPAIVAKLILLKNSRKLKMFKPLSNNEQYYNYSGLVLEEYRFSASSTPLIYDHDDQYQRRSRSKYFKSKGNIICSMIFVCKCFGRGFNLAEGAAEAVDHSYSLAIETVPAAIITINGEVGDHQARDSEEDDDDDDHGVDGDEDESVDQRAERFIQWFHQEMRLQRQDSF